MKWSTSPSVKAFCAAALLLASAVAAQAQTRFSSISVDASAVARRDGGAIAGDLRSGLEAELRKSFAERLGAGGKARLVVRLERVTLASLPDAAPKLSSRGPSNDTLKGEALIVSPSGRILASHPLFAVSAASAVGAWYLPDNEQRRVRALSATYAYWLSRELAGL